MLFRSDAVSADNRSDTHTHVELRAGFAATLPDDVHGESEQVRWAIHFENKDGTVHAEFDLATTGGELQPEEYAAYRALLGQLDQALGRMVELVPAQANKVSP